MKHIKGWACMFLIALIMGSCGQQKEKDQKATNPEESTPVPDAAHNSRNALDWNGTYRGILPCADCEGIRTELQLHKDMTFVKRIKYLGNPEEITETSGTFKWDDTGSSVQLNPGTDSPEGNLYKIMENRIAQLDSKGEMITGDLADKYILEKAGTEVGLTDGYWRLTTLGGRDVEPEDPNREAHLIFTEENNKVAGSNSCNRISGTYTLEEGDRMRFSQMISTQMACLPNEIEGPFMKVLERTDSYNITGDTLSLYRARMAPLAKFVLDYMK